MGEEYGNKGMRQVIREIFGTDQVDELREIARKEMCIRDRKWSIRATNRPGTNYPGGAYSTEDGIIFWGNRGADTIAAVKTGKTAAFLGEWACRGSWPRSVLASGRCVFAACQKSGTLESFIWNGRMLEQSDCLKLEEAACVIAWQME